jgi:[ribosomal protein S5]-alanine N-acetyltransferase
MGAILRMRSALPEASVTTLHTERLTLRPVEPGDTRAFEAFYSDPEVMAIRKYGVLDAAAARKQLATMLDHWTEYGFGMWVVEDKVDGEFAGECGLRWQEDASDVELSYGLLPRFRGRGLATEAARAALDFGIDVLSLARIVALSRGDNVKSHRVLEKLGMQLEWRREKGTHGLVRYLLVPDRNPPESV